MSNEPDTQYERHSILRYEQIFGKGFLSPGGLETTVQFCQRLKLKPGLHVLDIGSGIGGAAFYMAKEYGARVTGIDLSQENIDIATEYLEQQNLPDVEFRHGSILALDREAGTFDVIWSRDTFLHIAQKPELFHRLYRWLTPGGQLLITDYARNRGSPSTAFKTYVQRSGYSLLDLCTYGRYLAEAGFRNIVIEDRTEQFLNLLAREKDRILSNSAAFLKDFDRVDMDYLVERWMMKIDFCQVGDMKWGLLQATRE
jgi:phosphoethanolamine N-methyltransferase